MRLFFLLFILIFSRFGAADPASKDLCFSLGSDNACLSPNSVDGGDEKRVDVESSIRARLDSLFPPNASGTVTFWLNSPGKKQFTTADDVTIYYKISHLDKNNPIYLTLFNISPADQLGILVQNQAIEVGRVYTYPDNSDNSTDLVFGQISTGLGLEVGREYFKAVVTSREIPYRQWFSLMDATNPRQLKSILCVQSLIVKVTPP
jgi:hypothetical protein